MSNFQTGQVAGSVSCGSSDQRNLEWSRVFTPKRFFEPLFGTDEPLILDVGAHRGETIRFFKAHFPNCQVIAFEPDPDNLIACQALTSEFDRVEVHSLAIGEENATVTFWRQDVSHLGGLLPISPGSRDSLGYAKRAPNTPIDVSVVCLNSFCRQHRLSYINLLKIDTQGTEVAVLSGAKDVLHGVACVMVEVSLFDFYGKTEGKLLAIEQIMHEVGHSLWDVSKVSKNPKNLRTDWLELVYISAPTLDRMRNSG